MERQLLGIWISYAADRIQGSLDLVAMGRSAIEGDGGDENVRLIQNSFATRTESFLTPASFFFIGSREPVTPMPTPVKFSMIRTLDLSFANYQNLVNVASHHGRSSFVLLQPMRR